MKTKLNSTRIDIPEAARAKLVGILNAQLASTIDLSLRAKQAHWNVKGANFLQLHELFDKLAGVATAAVDEIAERAVVLGGVAEGTLETVAQASSLTKYSASATQSSKHLEALADSLATLGKGLRRAIDEATKLKDADTADLFTGLSREIDQYLWFVEAHLQDA